MTDEERIKSILESKKENIMKAFRNKVTYEKWDKYSPIWAYNVITGEVEKITDIEAIAFLLQIKYFIKGIEFFFNKEDVDIYKLLHDFIETEIDNAIMKGFELSINNIVNKHEDSQAFLREFHSNKVSEEFLDSCKKAGELFGRK